MRSRAAMVSVFLATAGHSVAFAQCIPTSRFATRVDPATSLVIVSGEREENRSYQYNPDEFGLPDGGDHRGRLTETGASMFFARAVSRSVVIAAEASVKTASFDKSADDASSLPRRTRESGLADLSAEVDYLFMDEGRRRPATFLVTEVDIPHSTSKRLVGTPGVLVRPALGAYKNFGTATILARLGGEYDSDSGTAIDWGEWTFEAGARVTQGLTLTGGFEGTLGGANNFDEVSVVIDAQWQSSGGLGVRVQNSTGFTVHSRGSSPEIGLVFKF